jgi:hypothetical protein
MPLGLENEIRYLNATAVRDTRGPVKETLTNLAASLPEPSLFW